MSGRRILCIEDDPGIAGLLAEVLTEAGFAVVPARNGLDGWRRCGAGIDAVICDIDLPGIDGLEVLRRIRGAELDGSGPRLPFILLTAYAQRDNQIEARRLGCDDFIAKPVDFELLLAVLDNALQRAPPRRPGPDPAPPLAFALTEREREIIAWVALGKTSSEIAGILGIAERTVNFHIEKTMRKLDVTTRTQAVVACVRHGLIGRAAPR